MAPDDDGAVLVTARLELAPLTAADVEEIHALWTSRGVRRFLFDDEVLDRETVGRMVAEGEAMRRESRSGLWAVRLRGERALAGFTGYWTLPGHPDPQLLYGIREDLWGRGLAAEAAAAVVRYGFEVLALDHVVASADAPNLASLRVMEKLGMRFVGRGDVGGLDTVFYRLDRP